MSDSQIGLGQRPYPIGHDPHGAPHYSDQRPNGGFTEERLGKLEYYQEELKANVSRIESDRVPTAADASFVCQSCNELSISYTTVHAFPICRECMKSLGMMTKARKNFKILEP